MTPAEFSFITNPIWDNILKEKAISMWGEDWRNVTGKRGGKINQIKCASTGCGEDLDGNGISLYWEWDEGDDDKVGESLIVVSKIKNGKGWIINDIAGAPAMIVIRPDGSIMERTYYNDGIIQDPTEEQPARLTYHENGAARSATRYRLGSVADSVAGMPGKLTFDENGTIIDGAFVNDRYGMVMSATPKELEKRIKSIVKRKVAVCCTGPITTIMGKSASVGTIPSKTGVLRNQI